jgi:hypothetical protein
MAKLALSEIYLNVDEVKLITGYQTVDGKWRLTMLTKRGAIYYLNDIAGNPFLFDSLIDVTSWATIHYLGAELTFEYHRDYKESPNTHIGLLEKANALSREANYAFLESIKNIRDILVASKIVVHDNDAFNHNESLLEENIDLIEKALKGYDSTMDLIVTNLTNETTSANKGE